MSIRIPSVTHVPVALGAALAGVLVLALALAPGAAAAKRTASAELRVLTPNRVLDPGTTYVVGSGRVKTDRGADCNFGGVGGSGASFDLATPTALGLLAAGADANRRLRPLSLTDEFGFGLAICAIGKVDDRPGTFWYLKRNHLELTVGADQEPIRDGDQFLVYLAPDTFPAPNPAELELIAPARAKPGEELRVRAVQHACITDQATFEVTCSSTPAEGVVISGGEKEASTAADGSASVRAGAGRHTKLVGRRGTDIPSNVVEVCVRERLGACPSKHGERIVGRSAADRIKGSKGADRIRARGGADRIDIRVGGPDRVDCGAGRDRVLVKRADRDDRISRDCERIRRR